MSTSRWMIVLAIGLYAGSAVSAVLATRRLGNKPLNGNEKEYLKEYAPAGVLFTVASGILITTHVREARRFESLLGVYDITRGALEDLKSAVPQKVLADAEARIVQKKVDEDFEVPFGVVDIDQPNVYCLDSTTGQQFISSVEKMHKVCQNLNYQVIYHMMATMDDYCDELGIEHINGGSQMGWADGPIVFSFSPRLKDDTIPVVVLSVSPLPSLKL